MPQSPNTPRSTALKLHDNGYWITPCKGKKAIRKGWQKNRCSREELIEVFRDPNLNIGLVVSQTNWIDVECDSPEAEQALQDMFDDKIPSTPTWKSRRGKHRLFMRPDGIPKKAAIEIEGIEFHIGNCKGAYSVIPPSKHPSGVQYKWIKGKRLGDIEVAELPPDIVERLKSAPVASAECLEDEAVPEGKRNAFLFGKATQCGVMKLPEDALADMLMALNVRYCNPPLQRRR